MCVAEPLAGAGCKTRLESSIQKCNPMVLWLILQAGGTHTYYTYRSQLISLFRSF